MVLCLTDAMAEVDVRDNPEESRYEVLLDGAVAGRSEYRLTGRTIIFIHTETDPAYSGQGLASTLVRRALDDVRARGLQVIARCPYVKAWIERHPAYSDLLAR